MADPNVSHPQWFPAYYPASGQFRDQRGDPSGAAGSKLALTFDFPTRPHLLIGMRIENVWALDDVQEAAETIDNFGAILEYIRQINAYQTVRTQFTQSDVVVKPSLQRTVIGGGEPPHTVHWHPLACPYPLRGGNKVTVELERLVSYPTLTVEELEIPIIPTVHVTWETVVGVEGAAFSGRDWGVPTFNMMPGGPGAGG